MAKYGKWFYLIGLLLAVLAALFGFAADWFSWILLLLAILAGIFYADTNDVGNAGLRYLIFVAVMGAFGGIPYIGTYLSTIFGAFAAFLAPVLLTTLLMWFFKKYFASKK